MGDYFYRYKPDHPNAIKSGYVAEHRLIMEKKIGRYLKKTELVHHIDHDPINNDIDNLTLLKNRGAHNRIHGWERDEETGQYTKSRT